MFTRIAFILIVSMASPLEAGTADKVRGWFDQQNYSNITRPGVYNGQRGRFATGGGISTRSSVVYPFRFVQVQTPKLSAGCGGIDLYAGGFTAVNAEQFIRNLRAIGENSASLAFMLALKIVSPQIEGTMEKIQTWANKYLNMNLDSCEAASALVGGAMDYMGATEGNCTVKRMNDHGEDWTTANYNCTTGGKRKSSEGTDANAVEFVKGNLAWYVLMGGEQTGDANAQLFRTDTEFAELIMNITGTIIIKDTGGNDDDPLDIRILNPPISGDIVKNGFQDIYDAILMGSDSDNRIAVFSCTDRNSDPYGCLTLSQEKIEKVPDWKGMHVRIKEMIQSIVRKILYDQALTAEEQGLLTSTRVPLYRFLTVITAYFPRGSTAYAAEQADDYISLIAQDIVLNALNAVIERVEHQTSNLKGGQSDTKRIKDYRDNLDKVLQGIAKLQKQNKFDMNQYFEIQKRIQLYEKALMSRLGSGFTANAMWGR